MKRLMFIASGSLCTRWLCISTDHTHKVRTVPWPLKAWTIAVANVSVEKNTPGLTVLNFCRNAMKRVMFISSGSLCTCRLCKSVDHTHKVRTVPWSSKARMIAVANVSVEKKLKASVSRDHQNTKSKKEVTGSVFACSYFCNHSNCSV